MSIPPPRASHPNDGVQEIEEGVFEHDKHFFGDCLTKTSSVMSPDTMLFYSVGGDIKLRDNGDGAKMFNGGQDKPAIEHLRTQTPPQAGPPMIPHAKNQRFFPRGPQFTPSPFVPIRSCFRRINEQLAKACMNTMCPFSETELRAAQPNLHSGRLRSLLQVAAR